MAGPQLPLPAILSITALTALLAEAVQGAVDVRLFGIGSLPAIVTVATAYSADNFIPLVPEIQENIQNIDHIIPTFWVRGGMSSRTVVRNIDYLKSCGLSR